MEGTGLVAYVETWGQAGRSEVWTGRETGMVVDDKGVVKEPVNAVVTRTSVLPSKKDAKYVALTFDEGPSAQTEQIVQILREKDARATFFVEGDKVSSNAAAVRAIAASGNELGVNAYSDTDLTELDAPHVRDQLTQAFAAVEDAANTTPTLLRPPFAAFSNQNWADAMDLVSAVITWNVDSGDWLLQGATSVVDTVVGSVSNGDIVLLTDNDATAEQTVEALPQLIDRLRENGYSLVTLSELIAADKDLRVPIDVDNVGLPKGASLPKLEEQTIPSCPNSKDA